MAKVNTHFDALPTSYVFSWIEERVAAFKQKNPSASLLNLGIGDIALPLVPSIGQAIRQGVDEMEKEESLRGYGPAAGYSFLRQAIAEKLYPSLAIDAEEIFVSDGINSDIINILDLFSSRNRIAIPNPSYPAYRSASLIGGRKSFLVDLPCDPSEDYLPVPPSFPCDLIFLCSPHNPTGSCLTKDQLREWVKYAHQWGAIILYDAAYAAFVSSPHHPRSIFEIEGAKEVAIEFGSFSKSAGFTGLRCAYTALPKELKAGKRGNKVSLHPLWQRRQEIKFNGVAYPIQKGALAALSSPGKKEAQKQVELYKQNAQLLKQALINRGLSCSGGEHSPYIWWKTPSSLSSWDFFDHLLHHHEIISLPGEGFGSAGQGHVRLSAFATRPLISQALQRLFSF